MGSPREARAHLPGGKVRDGGGGSIVQNYRQGSADAFQEETKESAKKKAAVVVSRNLAVNNSPVEINAAITFRRFLPARQ